MSLQHVVLFSFPDPLTAPDAAWLRAQVQRWPERIGGIGAIRLGESVNTERTRGYQYLLYMEFPDAAALASYQAHRVHQEFLRWVIDRDCTPLAFDYPLDAGTVIWPPFTEPVGG